jgi:peptide/nickel transport system substrate-binding protein
LHFGTIGGYPTLEGQTITPPALDNLFSVWDRLVSYDAAMQPRPMLADSWDINSGGTEIKLNLRKGVQFHTGREFTADDVKFSLERIQDPKVGGGVLAGFARAVSGFDIPDRYTVVVKASRPWPEAFDLLAQANIVDQVTLQSDGLSKPTGTGPFVFSEYAQGDHLRLVRNKNYWQRDRPYLDEVLVSIHADAQAAVVQLESGALDLLGFGLPVSDAVRLQSDPQFTILFNTNTGASWNLIVNCGIEPTNDKRVRQALGRALNRDRIAQLSWSGLAQAEALPWSVKSRAYDAAKAASVAFDREAAKALLRSAGVSNASLEITWPTSVDFAAAAQVYQSDLAAIGVSTVLTPLEPAGFVQKLLSRSFQGLSFVTNYAQFQPAAAFDAPLYSPDSNWAGFKDEAFSQLAGEIVATTDPALEKPLFDRLNDYLLDQAWILPITQAPEHLAAHSRVHGLAFDSRGALVLSDVWLQ